MSDLEGDTQKFLEDMLVGQAVTLSALEQAVLSAWLVKTMMVLDSAAKSPFFSQAEREWVRERREPPVTVRGIWIGAHSGPNTIVARLLDLRGGVGSGTAYFAPALGIVFTLVGGCFAAQVVAVGIKHDEAVTLRFNKDIEERVIAIRSPTPLIRSIDWPPKFSFEDGNASLEDFAGRFTA